MKKFLPRILSITFSSLQDFLIDIFQRKRHFACAITILSLLIFRCNATLAEEVVRAYISSTAPLSFHPNDSGTELITNYINQLFDTLTYIDTNGHLVPALAVSWKYVDKYTYVFKLRQGVYFHNSEPFNADSVVFTFRLFLNPKERVDNRFYWGPIGGVEKIDNFTVKIKLSKPDSLLPYRIATIGQILPPKYYKEVGHSNFSQHPIGTGSFTFKGIGDDGILRFVANYKCWKGSPKIDEIQFHFQPTVDEAINDILKDHIDFISMVPGKYTMNIAKSRTLKLVKIMSHNSAVVMLNTKKEGILKKPTVRQALKLGLNIEDVVKYGYAGNGKAADAITHEGELYHPTGIAKSTFSIDRAKALLKSVDMRSVPPLNVVVVKPLDVVGRIIDSQIRELGFKTKIEYVSAEGEKAAVLQYNQRGEVPDVDIFITFCGHRYGNGSFPMLVLMHSKGTWSITSDDKLDQLLDIASNDINSENQIKYFRLASKYIADNNLIIPGFQMGEIYALRNNLNYHPHQTGYIYFHNLAPQK